MCQWFGFGGFGWLEGLLALILTLIVIGIIIRLVMRASMGGRGYYWHHMQSDYGGRALDIARERYAKGEINKEQFEQIKKDLS